MGRRHVGCQEQEVRDNDFVFVSVGRCCLWGRAGVRTPDFVRCGTGVEKLSRSVEFSMREGSDSLPTPGGQFDNGGGGDRKEKGSCPAVFLFRETDFARTINTTSCCSRDRLAQVGAELDAIGADAAEGTVRKILTGLGFTDEMQVCTCCVVSWCGCGGKTKLSWACAVLDFLFCSGSQHSDSSGCCWVFSFAFPPETPSQANIFLVPNP